ncbi:probable LRR receptor-like serine/threonine-protein kinase At3g47570 [Magnolia sinica]|uniref:probable LRR receptor-like serine/threonine-protein kinase At3g47570 n=1 Tax=Magnolia sinica TaxID=86752 RepID=UPI002657E572|nr:probable LRR receptor-like serine/threonine-protein kinase At3g47570 [Magnolia sinica]
MLQGGIPNNLSNCSELRSILLDQNELVGRIPVELISLSKLVSLNLGRNNLMGNIPPPLGNLSSLVSLYLHYDSFEGSIPDELGQLAKLQNLETYSNKLSANLGLTLPNLKYLYLSENAFTGLIPVSLPNASRLAVISFANNNFSGPMPGNFGRLQDINILFGVGGGDNDLSFLTSLTNCSHLEGLYLYSNRLSGQIPSSIGNITRLVKLYLDGNCLQGSIPLSLGNCRHLETLVLSRNKLNGTIPKEILSFHSLVTLNIDQNSLVGSLPPDVGKLELLQYLFASHNKLMGEIPREINNCLSLEVLNLSNNLFQGAIPLSLSNFKGIKLLDLSHNNLSGHIPEALQKFPFLEYLDLSSNDLEGQIVFKNSSKFSILGNKKLCGGIPQFWLPVCPKNAPKKDGMSISLKVIISIVGAVLGLILLSFLFATVFWVRRKASTRLLPAFFLEGQFLNVSYADLFKATGGFSLDNLIGVGSYGSVYKGLLDHDQTCVAVKVFNLQEHGASRSFMVECEALRNIRHRNLVKIISACSSIDFKGNDFKALEFEYMPNGSLEKWLHPSVHWNQELWSWNLIQRLDIAIDVASALEYLHHHCQISVIHRDLKPSNVLLDDDMCAHVGDFGLARFLSNAATNTSQDQTTFTTQAYPFNPCI